jgi:hypothetical protein
MPTVWLRDAVTADATAPGSLGQQWREAQHPPIDSDVVDLDATLDQEFFDVAIRQAVAEVPAHRQHDDVGWGTEAGEGRAGGWSRTRAAVLMPAVWLLEGGHRERNSAASCMNAFAHPSRSLSATRR